jgi:Protein of unknown function (DUF2892)
MKCNVGHTDRVVRMTLGMTLMGLAGYGIVGAWGWIGIVPFVTGAIGNCPLYSLLGINTAKK